MPTYFLWVKQCGDGCDYTIGCGEKLIELPNVEDDKGELDRIKLESEVKQKFSDYGVGPPERELDRALVLKLERVAMPLYNEYLQELEERFNEQNRSRKLAELERLKRELGVD